MFCTSVCEHFFFFILTVGAIPFFAKPQTFCSLSFLSVFLAVSTVRPFTFQPTGSYKVCYVNCCMKNHKYLTFLFAALIMTLLQLLWLPCTRYNLTTDDERSHFLSTYKPWVFFMTIGSDYHGRDLSWCCTIGNLFLCTLHNFLDLEECHLSSLSCLLTVCVCDHLIWCLDFAHTPSQVFHIG